jgi:ABC-type nitrate/sulfonate/bicarbonate transport system substrate-binding protein
MCSGKCVAQVLRIDKRRALSNVASIGILAIIVIAGVAGFAYYFYTNPPSTGGNTSTSGQLTDVTMGFAGVPDVTDTPGFMLWQTFAQQLGLRIHVQYYDGDTTVADAVVAGNVQIGEGGFQAVIAADEKAGNSSGSFPFVVWGTYEASQDFGLLVSNSIPAGCWSCMANQPVAISSPGSTSYTICKLLLTLNGLSDSEANCAAYHGTPSRYAALLAGKVVGDITEPFYMVDAVETGNYHIMATVPQVAPDLLFSSLYSTRAYMTAHPDIVLKIEEATLLADRWAHNETAWIAKEQEEFPGTNATIAGASWKIWMAMNIWAPNGGLSFNAMNYSATFFAGPLIKASSRLSYVLPPKYWSDMTVQQNAVADLGPYTTCPVFTGCVDPSVPNLPITIPGVTT